MLAPLALIAAIHQADLSQRILETGLTDLGAYSMLADLCKGGPRLSGSREAANAVKWGEAKMRAMGFQNVRLVPCMVPHWVRGDVEKAQMIQPNQPKPTRTNPNNFLSICALGGSIATSKGGVIAGVIEVKSLDEAAKLGERAKGKIIFYNRPFDAKLPNTFEAYGGAVDQRSRGAVEAAKVGAIGVLVRSMTLAQDDEPHTGGMRYEPAVKKIPAAALGPQSATRLSKALAANPALKVNFELSCKTLPDAPSSSVIGEITGSVHPSEVIVIGGHLDSWDLGVGAHDDGAGCAQSMEALRLMKKLGMKPKRTIRAVLFMNEENGLRGALAYAEWVKKSGEVAYAAMESDTGGFMPRVFGVTEDKYEAVQSWLPALSIFGIERFEKGGGGADIGPLAPLGATLFGFEPQSQRYFDYHHSRNDTMDKVNARELQFGAMAMAMLAWKISEEGL